MIEGSTGQIHSANGSNLVKTRSPSIPSSGNIVPSAPSNQTADTVHISETAKSQSGQKAEPVSTSQAAGTLIDLSTREGKLQFGLAALRQNTVAGWTAKGLEVSEEALINAAEAMQAGFKENLERYGPDSMAGSRTALNAHQIVMNSQEVPDWFAQEYQQNLNTMDNPEMKAAFQQGATYFSSPPSAISTQAIANYTSITRYE